VDPFTPGIFTSRNMEDKKIVVNLASEQKEPLEIVVREGDASPIFLKDKVRLKQAVFLLSIAEFIGKRTFNDDPKENAGLLLFSTDVADPKLEFYENPHDQDATILTAKLHINPDFEAFAINTGKGFYQKDVIKLVRTVAHVLGKEQAQDIIQRMQNFEVKYEQVVQKEDDRQGNKKDLQTEALKLTRGELPKSFTLTMPLYKGTQPVTFTAEVEVDKGNNNMPVFSFYSLDMAVLQRAVADQEIRKQVDLLKDRFPALQVG